MKKQICLFAAWAVSVSAAAETSSVYLRGILNLGETRQFSVATEGGAKTAWVTVGDSFAGYEVADFDEAGQALVLRKDGEEFRLELAGARVSEAKAESGTAHEEAAELLRSMKFDEMMTASIEAQKEMMERMFRQMGQQHGVDVSEEAVAAQMRFIEAFHEELDWAGMKEDMIRAYGETFSKEELRGLIDFYSTPAGRSFVEKQGALSEKMMTILQPRMLNAMQKLQPMMMEMQKQAREERGAARGAEGRDTPVPVEP